MNEKRQVQFQSVQLNADHVQAETGCTFQGGYSRILFLNSEGVILFFFKKIRLK